jgi:hypothetical protein
MKQITPGYISIKVNGNNPQSKKKKQEPLECIIPDDVLTQFGPPDDGHLLLETCRGVK